VRLSPLLDHSGRPSRQPDPFPLPALRTELLSGGETRDKWREMLYSERDTRELDVSIMTLTLYIPEEQEAALRSRAQAWGLSAEEYAQRLLYRDLTQERRRPVSVAIREFWSDMPDEVRAKLPADGADQVDHYVYGVPKREP
jgi:plasmid stability protein